MIQKYIFAISRLHKKTPKIDSVFLGILEQFALEKSLSAYQVCSKLKSTDLDLAYKNVNKRIHGLESLNLIEETKSDGNNVSKHNAKYYCLTEYGIYQLFLNKLYELRVREFNTVEFTKAPSSNTLIFFRNHADSLLFQTFLYPYFEKDTLFAIGDDLLWNSYEYLADCCYRVKDQIELYIHNPPVVKTAVFYWNKIYGIHKNKLLLHLKEQFNLENIDSCEIGESKHAGNTEIITVKTSAAPITLHYAKDEQKVTIMSRVSGGQYKELEYDVDKVGSDILVGKQRTDKEQLKEVVSNIKNQIQQIIYGFIYNLSVSASDSKRNQEVSYYRKILSQDRKFMAIVEDIYRNRHKGFEKGYQMLNS